MPGMGHVPLRNLHGKRSQDQQAQMKTRDDSFVVNGNAAAQISATTRRTT